MFGDEAGRSAELARALLPWACLAPAAVLRRLMLDAALHRRQVSVASAPGYVSGIDDHSCAVFCSCATFGAIHRLMTCKPGCKSALLPGDTRDGCSTRSQRISVAAYAVYILQESRIF